MKQEMSEIVFSDLDYEIMQWRVAGVGYRAIARLTGENSEDIRCAYIMAIGKLIVHIGQGRPAPPQLKDIYPTLIKTYVAAKNLLLWPKPKK